MIDLVSTRIETPEHVKSDLHLIAALIAHRIQAACTKPTSAEKTSARNEVPEARAAIDYLFNDKSRFSLHADMIGMDAENVRFALLGRAPLNERGPFTPMHRRCLNLRHLWWKAEFAH